MPTRRTSRFTDAEAARKYLETIFWPDGAICAHCGAVGKATLLKGKSTRAGVYWCNACKKPFTVTVGTIFESSKVPLNSWLYVNHLLCNSRKRISVRRLARIAGVTYKTAWFMAHHIRDVMASSVPVGRE
ncbi:MAG TPA: IS1595 family transposase [Rhizomicrobium sp.]|jgi:transposase-like protein